MQKLILAVVVCLVAGVKDLHARTSPNADLLELAVASGLRGSNDLFEDARLDVPGLLTKYGYVNEVHHVTTPDGYILEMHRIPHGKNDSPHPNVKRPVVFVMHGLISSSADFVSIGPDNALAYFLADEGFDVWLGNARGNYYSRQHETLDANSKRSGFWEFSWHEIGSIDLPAMIDYALEMSGQDSLHYIGHSQGTTSVWVLLSTLPEYNNKVKSVHAMAPVAYMEHIRYGLLKDIATYSSFIQMIANIIGLGELFRNSDLLTYAGTVYCDPNSAYAESCAELFFTYGQQVEGQLNSTILPVILGHTPAGCSVKQIAHYGQSVSGHQFRQWDYGNSVQNLIHYGRLTPPDYNLRRITTPVALYHSLADALTGQEDVARLANELPNVVLNYRIFLETFTHIDFALSHLAKTHVYNVAVQLMRSLDNMGT